MKLGSLLVVMCIMAPIVVTAQDGRSDALKSELNREVEQLYKTQPKAQRKIVSAKQMNLAPIVVSDLEVQERPESVVKARPLTDSKADRLRQQREKMEQTTELRIVEELEADRMREEEIRAQRMFGGKLDKRDREAQQEVAPAPVVVATPEAPAEAGLDKEGFKDDLRSIVSELKTSATEEEEYVEPARRYYLSILGGAGAYPGVSRVKGVIAFGGAFGLDFGDGLSAETSFTFSTYDLCKAQSCLSALNSSIIEMDQKNLSFAVKYTMDTGGRINPVFGAITSFNIRDYKSARQGTYYSPESTSSKSLDIGALVGADVVLSEKVSIGVDLRYMMNLTNRVNRDNFAATSAQFSSKPIEELNYYLFNISAKLTF